MTTETNPARPVPVGEDRAREVLAREYDKVGDALNAGRIRTGQYVCEEVDLALAALATEAAQPEGVVPSGVREALEWYAERVADCRKITSEGDNARNALDLDGGKRAREALAAASPTPPAPLRADAGEVDDHERAYFERGMFAAYAWMTTKRRGEQLSDAVVDHAWENRDAGMGPTECLPKRPFTARQDAASDAGVEQAFRPMDTWDQRDETVLLLIDYDDGEHPLDDARFAITIGHNNDHNVGDDEGQGWKFAGWCWTHDHYTQGKGTPVGWMPLPHILARAYAAFDGEALTTPKPEASQGEEPAEAEVERLRRMRNALQDIADAEAIPNGAEAFVWCRTTARAALSTKGEGA